MRGVDDVGGHVDRVFRRLSGARGIAGKRIDHPDLDGIGRLRRNADGGRKHYGNDAPCFHLILPKSDPPDVALRAPARVYRLYGDRVTDRRAKLFSSRSAVLPPSRPISRPPDAN